MMFRNRAFNCLLVVLVSSVGLAHEGHEQPGALPSAPHGGKVKEAMGASKTQSELFFEAVYLAPNLTLYALTLPQGSASAFKALSPAKAISSVALQVEFPRAKKTASVSAKVGAETIEAVIIPKGSNRFIVHVSAVHEGETKKAKIQMELK